MNISIILASPHCGSFNHAIAQNAFDVLEKNGYTVFFHDLYKEKFDAVLPADEIRNDAVLPPQIRKYCDELISSDGIILVHPNWWGQPPSILKGWLDRVIRPKVAYRFLDGDKGEGIPVGLLKAETALVFNTANTSQKRESEVFGDPLENLWKNCVFAFCGVKYFYRKMFTVVVTSSAEERAAWLEDVRTSVNKHFPPVSR